MSLWWTHLVWPLSWAAWETGDGLGHGWKMWARLNPGTCPWLGTRELGREWGLEHWKMGETKRGGNMVESHLRGKNPSLRSGRWNVCKEAQTVCCGIAPVPYCTLSVSVFLSHPLDSSIKSSLLVSTCLDFFISNIVYDLFEKQAGNWIAKHYLNDAWF